MEVPVPELTDHRVRRRYVAMRDWLARNGPSDLVVAHSAERTEAVWRSAAMRDVTVAPDALPDVAPRRRWYRLTGERAAQRVTLDVLECLRRAPFAMRAQAAFTPDRADAWVEFVTFGDAPVSARFGDVEGVDPLVELARIARSPDALREVGLKLTYNIARIKADIYARDMHWLLRTRLPIGAIVAGADWRSALRWCHATRAELVPPQWAIPRPVPTPERPIPPGADDSVSCPRCKRRGAWYQGRTVTNGNPMSPASDCDVEHEYTCLDPACDHDWSVSA